MKTLLLASASALALVAAPVLAQEATDTTDPTTILPDATTGTDTTTATDSTIGTDSGTGTTTATDTTTGTAAGTDTMTATDSTGGMTGMPGGQVEQSAIQSAEGVGIQNARGVQDVVVLEGTMDTGTQVYLIVGPDGELLALASPLSSMPGSPGTQSGVATDSSSDQAATGMGGDPSMWDATQIENVMRRFQDSGTGAGTGLDSGVETGTEGQSN